jgi:hypothetical protein
MDGKCRTKWARRSAPGLAEARPPAAAETLLGEAEAAGGEPFLLGDPLELAARELNVVAAEAALKKRECDERDDEIARLNGKVIEITMENELLRQHSLAGRPSWPQDISSGQGRPAGHRAGAAVS